MPPRQATDSQPLPIEGQALSGLAVSAASEDAHTSCATSRFLADSRCRERRRLRYYAASARCRWQPSYASERRHAPLCAHDMLRIAICPLHYNSLAILRLRLFSP